MSSGHWLLLERTEHLLQALYQLGEAPDPVRLFDDTELAAYEAESPLLIDAQGNPSLLAAMRSKPLVWPGLLLETPASTQHLLAHLRHMLFTRFDQERRGVLRYSRPRTASYFFACCDAETRSAWLGPVQRLSWYGGTWHEYADGQEAWRHVENLQATVWRRAHTEHELHLSIAQEKALQRQQSEHFLYQWWEGQRGIGFQTAWSYLTAGMQAGFLTAKALTAYLDLRHANPYVTPPDVLPPGTDQERLDSLARHLTQNTTDKERSV